MILKREHILTTLFYVYLLLILTTRICIYFEYNIQIIDTDQPYMWLGATDYAKGLFYEPRYYGQDYNTFFEAFCAIPLLYFNIPVYKALPIISNVLSLFPFLFMAIYLHLKNQKIYALLILSILICLPIQYDLLNTLPRGFVTGLFFSSFYILSIVNPQSLFLIFLNTAFAVLGYYINQNSIIVSVPFLFYLFLIHKRDKTYYYVSGTALLLAYPIDLFFNAFYRHHPDYVCQSTFNTFSFSNFSKSIQHLDERFQHISFFIPHQSYTLIFVFILLGILLFKQNQKAFLSFLLFIGLILFSFSASKVSDGSKWVFMSFSRMFLGIPILLGLFFSLVKFDLKKIYFPVILIPLFFSIYKIKNLKTQLDKEDQRTIAQGVRVLSIKSCIEMNNFYKTKCKENGCNFLLVSSTFWLNTIVSTAGAALDKDYPETQETRFEKRYWIRNKNKNRLINKFMFLSSDYQLDQLIGENKNFQIQKVDDYGLFIIEQNKLSISQFINTINAIEPGLND